YYGSTEYVGKDPYGHFNRPLGTVDNRAELKGNSIPQQQYRPYRPLGTVDNRAELDGLFLKEGVNIGYLAPSIHELNAMSMEGTVSTEIYDRNLFNDRYESMKERIKTYNFNENRSFFEKVVVGFQSVNQDITAIYIKATDIAKRKVYWTV